MRENTPRTVHRSKAACVEAQAAFTQLRVAAAAALKVGGADHTQAGVEALSEAAHCVCAAGDKKHAAHHDAAHRVFIAWSARVEAAGLQRKMDTLREAAAAVVDVSRRLAETELLQMRCACSVCSGTS